VSGASEAARVTEATLRELVLAGSLQQVTVIGDGPGFAVEVAYGAERRMLGTARGEIRLFAALNTVAEFLRGIGVSRFDVDVSHYSPGRLRAARPDKADALRRTRTKLRQGNFFEGSGS